jgi:hypothetical protein
VFNGEVRIWLNKLRNPERRQRGCIAVNEEGHTWTTIAGSESAGALLWLANDELYANFMTAQNVEQLRARLASRLYDCAYHIFGAQAKATRMTEAAMRLQVAISRFDIDNTYTFNHVADAHAECMKLLRTGK